MLRNYIFHIPETCLASRTDNLTGQSESFVYDNLDRLKRILGYPIQNAVYTANGNITSNTAGGTYSYQHPTKLHAVTTVAKTAGASSQPLQNISYTKFNKALSITQYLKVTPQKTLTYDITYGPDQQRVKTIYTDTSGYKTLRYYSGSYEKDSMVVGSTKTVKKIHYIMGGTGLVAVYIKWSTGQDSMFYVCKDRQGSIVALVKQNGTVSERYSYDAWGRRRNPSNWTDYNVPAPRLISRGYTGHEHLDGFGLINMNGRMYDPVIGRILSPDNFVQDPTNTQSYNRYSYCLNNPLRYTDPSGWFAAAADQYWNMGKDITDFISFSGLRASSANGTSGSGQGWGGVGGVVPQGIHWMARDVTIDDLVSLYEVTPRNGKLYTYSNVNGDWYNTSTSIIGFMLRQSINGDGYSGDPKYHSAKLGKGPGSRFISIDEAAMDFGVRYNDNSIRKDCEYGTIFYSYQEDGKLFYSYTPPIVGYKDHVSFANISPLGTDFVGVGHTHGRGYGYESFSEEDKQNCVYVNYLCTPEGSLYLYDARSNSTTVINRNLPNMNTYKNYPGGETDNGYYRLWKLFFR